MSHRPMEWANFLPMRACKFTLRCLVDNQTPIQTTRTPEREARKQCIYNISDFSPGFRAVFSGIEASSFTLQCKIGQPFGEFTSTAEAMDRRSRGADSMQALVIAGTLNARPKPIAIRMRQKTRYGVVVSVRHMLRNPAAPISESTIVGIYLEPVRKLSTRLAISSAA